MGKVDLGSTPAHNSPPGYGVARSGRRRALQIRAGTGCTVERVRVGTWTGDPGPPQNLGSPRVMSDLVSKLDHAMKASHEPVVKLAARSAAWVPSGRRGGFRERWTGRP